MRYIGFEKENEAELWARKKLKLTAPPQFFRTMSAVGSDSEFVCVVLLTNFSQLNVDINIAIEKSNISPKEAILMYNRVFEFIFDKLKIVRVTGLVSANNMQSRKITPKFGFKLEGRMRKAFADGSDLLIFGMLSDEYKQHAWSKKGIK